MAESHSSEPGPEDVPEETLYVVGQRLPSPRQVRDRRVVAAAVLAALGGVIFAVGLLAGAPRSLYGTGLAVGLLALAVGVNWYISGAYPEIEAIEPRPGPEEGGEAAGEVVEPARRSVLGWLLAGAAGVLAVSFLAPVSSLGPRAGDRLRHTLWREGTRLVTSAGRAVRPDDLVAGSLVTVWPEHAVRHERSAVVVLRLRSGTPRAPTETDWVVDRSVVAYSKICTHAGCPVGLFRERDDALFCPCHLATFDAARAAIPTFGPAGRRLPQLPLGVNGDGELVALGDFVQPIGPAYGWMARLGEDEES